MAGVGGAASISMTASFEYGSESRKTLLSEREMAADVMASSASSSSVSSAAVRRRAAFFCAITASTCWKPTARERREDAEKEAAEASMGQAIVSGEQ